MIFLGFVKGYYYPSRKTGLNPIFSVVNAIRLAWRTYKENYL